MKRNNITIAFVLVMFTAISVAQQNNDYKPQTIFDNLATPDSVSHASVTVHQDQRIELAMIGKRSSANSQSTSGGFRVQVFSSNTQRTAKRDAFRIEKQIQDEFPDASVYVNYASPFWKVRVGDFKTQAEAHAFRSQIIEAFPQMRSETYIVKEQISTSGSK